MSETDRKDPSQIRDDLAHVTFVPAVEVGSTESSAKCERIDMRAEMASFGLDTRPSLLSVRTHIDTWRERDRECLHANIEERERERDRFRRVAPTADVSDVEVCGFDAECAEEVLLDQEPIEFLNDEELNSCFRGFDSP